MVFVSAKEKPFQQLAVKQIKRMLVEQLKQCEQQRKPFDLPKYL